MAARRAARYGDGFFPGRGDPHTLAALLDVLRDECRVLGRDPASIEVTVGSHASDPETLNRLRDLGVHRIISMPPAFDAPGLTDGLRRYADNVIAPFGR